MFFKSLLSATLLVGASMAQAADFFDTGAAESFLDLGVRAGVNASNMTVNDGVFNEWNHNSWGTGLDAGVVANLNFRNFISLQPGLFFQWRNGAYDYVNSYFDADGNKSFNAQWGKIHSTSFTVPIMCSVHFNITDNIRWNVDLGPYFQFIMHNSASDDFACPVYEHRYIDGAVGPTVTFLKYKPASAKSFDFGVKFGTGLDILKHYYVGVHYMAGCLNAWDNGLAGGRNKCWSFTVGYNF